MAGYLCFLLMGCVFFQTIAPELAQASMWADRGGAWEADRKKQTEIQELLRLKLSPSEVTDANRFAEIRTGLPFPKAMTSVADSGWNDAESAVPLIIHIQDAHGHFNAQYNAAAQIKRIAETYQRKHQQPLIVYVEGSWKPVRLTWLKLIPDAAIRSNLALKFLYMGWLTGEEYLSVLSKEGLLEIRGIEDESIFKDNVAARRAVEPFREQAVAYFAKLQKRLERLEQHYFPADVLQFLNRHHDYHQQTLTLFDYVHFLKRQFPRATEAAEFEQMHRYFSLKRAEASFSQAALEREVNHAAKIFTRDLSDQQLSQFKRVSLQYQLGKIDALAYYEMFLALAQLHQLSLPAMQGYRDFIQSRSKLDVEALTNEVVRLEDQELEKMNQAHPEIAELIQIAVTLERDSRFWQERLSPSDWIRTMENPHYAPNTLHNVEIANTLLSFEQKMGGNISEADWVELLKAGKAIYMRYKQQKQFYVLAHERDKILARNLLLEMSNQPAAVSVLITGGFHTPGLIRLLRRRGYAYMVLRPNAELYASPHFLPVDEAAGREHFERFLQALKQQAESLDESAEEKPLFASLSRFLEDRVSTAPLPRGAYGRQVEIRIRADQPENDLRFRMTYEDSFEAMVQRSQFRSAAQAVDADPSLEELSRQLENASPSWQGALRRPSLTTSSLEMSMMAAVTAAAAATETETTSAASRATPATHATGEMSVAAAVVRADSTAVAAARRYRAASTTPSIRRGSESTTKANTTEFSLGTIFDVDMTRSLQRPNWKVVANLALVSLTALSIVFSVLVTLDASDGILYGLFSSLTLWIAAVKIKIAQTLPPERLSQVFSTPRRLSGENNLEDVQGVRNAITSTDGQISYPILHEFVQLLSASVIGAMIYITTALSLFEILAIALAVWVFLQIFYFFGKTFSAELFRPYLPKLDQQIVLLVTLLAGFCLMMFTDNLLETVILTFFFPLAAEGVLNLMQKRWPTRYENLAIRVVSIYCCL